MTLVQKVAFKLFEIVDRKQEYKKVMEESSERALSTKSAEDQYQDKAKQVLSCTALTCSVTITYIENTKKEELKTTNGHATRKQDSRFQIDLVDNQ